MEAVLKICLLFSIFSVAFSSQKGVPAIIWSNDKSRTFPVALTGHSIGVQQFKDDYLPHSTKHNMLLFMQDKLSMEDFTQYADVYNAETDGATFHNLKHIMESQASSHVPSLSSSSDLVAMMTGMAGRVHTLASPYSVKDLPLDEQAANLILVELPPTSAGLHTREALKQIDAILQSVNEQMQSLAAPFTAVYTAKASSKPVGPSVSAYSGGRHLLQAVDATNVTAASFWNLTDGCLYLYAQAIMFEVYTVSTDTRLPINLKSYTLPAMNTFTDDSICANNSATLVVKYDTLPPPKEGELTLTSFEFKMEFSSDVGYWTLDNMFITYDATIENSTKITATNEQIESKLTRDIFAPSSYSYHCSFQPPFRSNATATEGGYFARVRTEQLQGQLNGASYGGEFGQVNDCIGFFTIPIWSALIAMLVLISIFFFGMAMLSSIDTQDRFDDPKGKTIQVNVNE